MLRHADQFSLIAEARVSLCLASLSLSADLAQHFLQMANVTVIRRVRKSDNNRIARATGATICHQPELMHEVQHTRVYKRERVYAVGSVILKARLYGVWSGPCQINIHAHGL